MFDFVTFGAVLEHLYDPSKAIEKVMGWVKAGGYVHIEVPSSRYLITKLLNLYYRFYGSDYVANTCPMHRPFHLYEFGLKSFEENAKLLNYEIAFYEYQVGLIPMPDISHVFLKPLMKWTHMGKQLCIWLRKPLR